MKSHTSKFRGERLKASWVLTALYPSQLVRHVLSVSVSRFHAVSPHPKCFGCPSVKAKQCTWATLFWGHPLTFRNADVESNVIGLRKDSDIFGLNNPQDIFHV